MPSIVYNGSKMSNEKKGELIRLLTEAAHQVTGFRKEVIYVFVQEYDKENLGVGGEQLSARIPKPD